MRAPGDMLRCPMGSSNAVCTVLLSAAIALAAGCGGDGDVRSPTATVRHFLEVMDRSAADDAALREAYHMLDASARAALAARAERATTLAGRRYEPWQMLSQGRYRQRFAPASPRGMRERVQGDRAVVTVSGRRPEERAEVSLVREEGHWRIVLAIPPMRGREG